MRGGWGTGCAALLGVCVLALGGPAWGQQGGGAAPKADLIAVMDLQPVGASVAEAQALSDRLREVMLKTGQFTLVDRGQMDQVLNEQALQQTGCTSQECAVQVGRILGVRKMVLGKVVKVSDTVWLLSAMLVDVETAQTLRAESVRHRGDFFALMDDRVREIGEKFSEPATKPAEPAVAAASTSATAPPAVANGAKGRFSLAIFPYLVTGTTDARGGGEQPTRKSMIAAMKRGIPEGGKVDVTFSYYPGFGLEPGTHQLSDDRTWTGIFSKDIDKNYVRSWVKELKVNGALALFIDKTNANRTVRAYVYDGIKDLWYERQRKWSSGNLVRDVARAVRDAVGEFVDRNTH